MVLYVFCLQSLIASNQKLEMGRSWEWCAFGEGRVERGGAKAEDRTSLVLKGLACISMAGKMPSVPRPSPYSLCLTLAQT